MIKVAIFTTTRGDMAVLEPLLIKTRSQSDRNSTQLLQ